MSTSLTNAFIYSAAPSAVAIAGAAGASFWQPPPAVCSALLHLAAGVVFAVVVVELLPRIMRHQEDMAWIIGGFVAGVLLMLAVRWLNRSTQDQDAEGRGAPISLIAGGAIDQVVDGVLLGVGIAAGAALGALLSVSMAVEDVSFGVAITLTLGKSGAHRWQMIATAAGLGGIMVLVTLIAALLLTALPTAMIIFLLAFGSAALLFIVTEQLLVEAHTVPQAPLLASVFFVGFLLMLVLTMLAG